MFFLDNVFLRQCFLDYDLLTWRGEYSYSHYSCLLRLSKETISSVDSFYDSHHDLKIKKETILTKKLDERVVSKIQSIIVNLIYQVFC